jgi:anti-sigma factor RsiW
MAMMEAKAALRRAGRRYEAPASLRTGILASTIDHGRQSGVARMPAKPPSLNWTRWAMAAAVLLLAAGLFYATNYNKQAGSLGEFADLHVANLASASPVEVVSTDRHTVKPWFQGRIPFTFDVPDLQGSPFTLTGGRVTYFHQEPGAQLIVASQRHMISVFIFRDTPRLAIREAAFADRSTSFNLETWTQDGLRYVLVGDVNSSVLQQLAGMLQHPR